MSGVRYRGVRCGGKGRILQIILRDHPADLGYVCPGNKLETDSAHTGEPQIQLTVDVKNAGSFHGEGLDAFIWQRGKIFLHAGNTLNVDGNQALIGEIGRAHV